MGVFFCLSLSTGPVDKEATTWGQPASANNITGVPSNSASHASSAYMSSVSVHQDIVSQAPVHLVAA
jgi:hypothetical protein